MGFTFFFLPFIPSGYAAGVKDFIFFGSSGPPGMVESLLLLRLPHPLEALLEQQGAQARATPSGHAARG